MFGIPFDCKYLVSGELPVSVGEPPKTKQNVKIISVFTKITKIYIVDPAVVAWIVRASTFSFSRSLHSGDQWIEYRLRMHDGNVPAHAFSGCVTCSYAS